MSHPVVPTVAPTKIDLQTDLKKPHPMTVASSTTHSLENGQSTLDSLPENKEAKSTLTDWDGPQDSGNPKNWSIGVKVYGVFVPAYYALAVTFGTSVYAAGIFDIETRYGVSRTVAILGLSLYALGLGLGPVLGAPISETLGRRWVYLITMPAFILLTMGAGLSKNIGSILVLRFLSALFGASAMAVGAGSVADLFDMQKGGGIAGMLFTMMPFLGSSIAPVVGGYTVELRGKWEWTMWVTIIISGPAWIASLFLRETSQKNILSKRALARGMTPPPKPPPAVALKMLVTVTLLRPVHMLFFEPIVAWQSLYVAFTFGILFAFFDAFPYVFLRYYGFSLGQVGLTYLSIVIGIFLASFTFGVIDKTLYAKAKAKVTEPGKVTPPEERLYSCMLGSIFLPISLFWFAWTAKSSVHWIVPILAGVPFGLGLILLFLGSCTYLIDCYQALNAASAIAANCLLRYVFAAAFPLFTVQMFDTLGVGWACSLLGFVSVLMLPIPWILYKWGPLLRRRSSYQMGNF